MTALLDKLVQRHVEGKPPLKVIGFKFALKHAHPIIAARREAAGKIGDEHAPQAQRPEVD